MKKKIKDCSYQEIKNYCFCKMQRCDECPFNNKDGNTLHLFCIYAHQVDCEELEQEIEIDENN